MESKTNKIQRRITDPQFSARMVLSELQSALNSCGELWTKKLNASAYTLSASLNRRAHALLRRQLWILAISCVAVFGAAGLGTYLANRSVLRASLEQQALGATNVCIDRLLEEREKLATLQRQVAAEQSHLDGLRASTQSAKTTLNDLDELIKHNKAYPLPQFRDSSSGKRYQFKQWPPEVHQTAAKNLWAGTWIRPVD